MNSKSPFMKSPFMKTTAGCLLPASGVQVILFSFRIWGGGEPSLSRFLPASYPISKPFLVDTLHESGRVARINRFVFRLRLISHLVSIHLLFHPPFCSLSQIVSFSLATARSLIPLNTPIDLDPSLLRQSVSTNQH